MFSINQFLTFCTLSSLAGLKNFGYTPLECIYPKIHVKCASHYSSNYTVCKLLNLELLMGTPKLFKFCLNFLMSRYCLDSYLGLSYLFRSNCCRIGFSYLSKKENKSKKSRSYFLLSCTLNFSNFFSCLKFLQFSIRILIFFYNSEAKNGINYKTYTLLLIVVLHAI
ncbi:unnamed protein product [Moneuplotes crassus]|uniref:Uncharacterized protein n=1 Tax=Euplotes crassus TaxID=5936 RepID=A0AAD1U886_EUPCR|nr:unnamed protein product [Moneuplotes crassus]